MKEFSYTITDPLGLHGRPASALVKLASQFQSNFVIHKDDQTGDLKRIISIMSLGTVQGETVRIEIEGEDEDDAAAQVETFFKENF